MNCNTFWVIGSGHDTTDNKCTILSSDGVKVQSLIQVDNFPANADGNNGVDLINLFGSVSTPDSCRNEYTFTKQSDGSYGMYILDCIIQDLISSYLV